MDHGAVAGERRRLDDLVVPFDREHLGGLVDQDFEEGIKILGVEARGGRRQPPRHIEMTDDLDAADLDDLVGLGRIDATISRVIRRGAGRPGISAVVTTMSCFLM